MCRTRKNASNTITLTIGIANDVRAYAGVSAGRWGSMPTFSGGDMSAPAAPVTPNVTSQSPAAVIVGTNLACPAVVVAVRSSGLPLSGAESPVVVGAAEKVTLVPSATGAPLSVTATSRNVSPTNVLPVTFTRYGPTSRFGTTDCI